MVATLTRESLPSWPRERWTRLQLIILIVIQAALYCVVAWLSQRFEFHSEVSQRPIGLVLGLLVIAFGLHLWSLILALQSVHEAFISRTILVGAALFRIILLPSLPIQEVDIYRYLWDGAVVAEGGNPYRFSPQQILSAPFAEELPQHARSLVLLRDQSPAYLETLQRIHYSELISVYPPVSQAVFGVAARVVPRNASLYQHVVMMKLFLVLLDLGTLWLVLAILRHVQRHAGWAILYGWSPLVLKEFGNSGHLDSIAVCLATGSVWALLLGLSRGTERTSMKWLVGSAVLLGLAVGAKLYPIVLLPVLSLWVMRRTQLRPAVCYGIGTLCMAIVSLSPMLLTEPATVLRPSDRSSSAMSTQQAKPAASGLVTFLSRWEINDLVFLIVVENLRPDAVDSPPHWFVITRNSWRTSTADTLSSTLQRPFPEATYLAARVMTLLCFVIVLGWLMWQAVKRDTAEAWLRTIFLTLAWFWTLAPTPNPWYWTWAMPLLPFAGRRAWCFVSLFVLAYYLRFTLLYHDSTAAVWGTNYHGEQFFHFVVVPLEHGVWLAWLAMEAMISRSVWPASQTRCDPTA